LTKCPVCGDKNLEVVFHDFNRCNKIECTGTCVKCVKYSLILLTVIGVLFWVVLCGGKLK